jgi:hypothetical protein
MGMNRSTSSAPRSPATTSTLRFHIGRLTIEGLARSKGIRVAEAIRGRLIELASMEAAPPAASHLDRIDGGLVPRGASAEEIGSHIALQIFKKLGRKSTRHA